MKINENRRLWEVDHKIEAVSDSEIKITVNGITEAFAIPSGDGEYYLEDSLLLEYNPIQKIIRSGGETEVATFYDDPYTREGFVCPFARNGKSITLVPLADNNLDMAKTAKYAELSEAYKHEFISGYFHSDVMGIDIDYRRNETKNDLQNVEVLIEVMEDSGITETEYKGYQDQKTIATIEQIKAMRKEILFYSTNLYGKKEGLENQVSGALTVEAVKNITW